MGRPDERMHPDLPDRLSLMQRLALRRLRREAGRSPGEPLSADDWPVLWAFSHTFASRAVHRLWGALPSSPRCSMCSAPFAGPGRYVTRPLGYRPSRKNPNFCATCVELSPPGGTTMPVGVLFADLRGFTSASEAADPEDVSKVLRRFYGCAEDVFFPEAIIDKLIGDEVMALYPQPLLPGADIPRLMIDHATELLRAVGYGTPAGPFVEVGIGIDFGEGFVGNIGDRAVFDFTAVGDVVNTASRLQSQAAGGEVFVAGRLADHVDAADAERLEVELKGKRAGQVAYRLTVGS